MRQQLRLKVLLPVAVLGLLGAGFGAFAMGSSPVPATSPPPPATTTAPAPAPQPAEPAPVGAVEAGVWVRQAGALCTEFYAKTVERPRTPQAAQAFLAQSVKIGTRFNARFAALGWPRGERNAVNVLRGDLERSLGHVRQALDAFRARDLQRILRIADRDAALVQAWNEEVQRLGAPACAVDTAPKDKNAPRQTSRPLTGAEALEWALYFDRVVVVVFSAGDPVVDAKAVLDARGAALDLSAGFLSVDVRREAQVAALAIGYEVLESPTVLVLTRGPRLRYRFEGYADRTTIAQAISNAAR
ncbi:MAG: hypothetical protein ACRDNI_02920 [Gaiellaceae bacterium]